MRARVRFNDRELGADNEHLGWALTWLFHESETPEWELVMRTLNTWRTQLTNMGLLPRRVHRAPIP